MYGGQMANPENNCNVPADWWMDNSRPDLTFQYGAYIGATRRQMQNIHAKVRQRGWVYVASEGSLEMEPIFGGPYFYSTILREPTQWVLSMWHYYEKFHKIQLELDAYLTTRLWGTPDFFTRRLCGVQCVLVANLTRHHVLRAKSMLDYYDLVLTQEMMSADPNATEQLLKRSFPTLTLPRMSAVSKKNVNTYNRQPNLTDFQIGYIQSQTLMDKVLYEYAKILHKRKLEEFGISLLEKTTS